SLEERTYTLPAFSKAVALKVKLNFAIVVGIEDANSSVSTQLYPNPTKGDIHIDFPSAGFSKVELANANGKTVFSQAIDELQTSTHLRPNVSPGLYLIKLTHRTKVYTSKVVIE
ncbi:MAG TPA: T9SS type A sorting domain-containing protein, partial [Chryseolinea sp.]|nr:T9SS type A sorting domain-containing protein [Chryseolinea sp.]